MYSHVPIPTCDNHVTCPQVPPPPGTEYVVMECIVMEGGDDVTLEPGDVVELVKVEGVTGEILRVRTTDEHRVEGTVPESYLRKREKGGGKMDGEQLEYFCVVPSRGVAKEMYNLYLYTYMYV